MPASALAFTNLDQLPLILTLSEMAAVYRISEKTIRRGLQAGTFSPRPFDKYPYRWKREDVIADLARPREERRRAHGFARTKRKPVKTTIDSGPLARQSSEDRVAAFKAWRARPRNG